MEAQATKDVKLHIYVDTLYTTRIDGAHTYNELFHLIKDGKGLMDDENLDEREEEELTIAQNLKKILHTQCNNQISSNSLCRSDQISDTTYRG
jgi:hypothetical protein